MTHTHGWACHVSCNGLADLVGKWPGVASGKIIKTHCEQSCAPQALHFQSIWDQYEFTHTSNSYRGCK